MVAVTEQARREQEANAERGKKTHGLITDLVKGFLVMPEFMNALGLAFFRRNGTNHGSNIHSVYFERNGSGYSVGWTGSPQRYGPEYVRNYEVTLGLSITKYDPRNLDQREPPKRTAVFRVSSVFVENQDCKILEFKRGNVELEKFGDKDPNIVRHDGAFEPASQVFSDIYPAPPVKL